MNDYKIEALVTVDGRGQIVVPKAVRKKTGINEGEKLVLLTSQISLHKGGLSKWVSIFLRRITG